MLYSFFGLLVCQLSIIKYCSLKNIIRYTKFIVNYHINSCNKCYLLGCRNSFILISFFCHLLCSIGKWEWNLVKKFALVEQEFCEGDDRKIAHYPPPSTAMCLFLLSQTDADACRRLCVGEVSVFHGHHGVDNWCRTINSWTGLFLEARVRIEKPRRNWTDLSCSVQRGLAVHWVIKSFSLGTSLKNYRLAWFYSISLRTVKASELHDLATWTSPPIALLLLLYSSQWHQSDSWISESHSYPRFFVTAVPSVFFKQYVIYLFKIFVSMNALITFVFCLSQAMSSPPVLEKARVTKNTMHNGDNFGI